jgi:hypothetical protein
LSRDSRLSAVPIGLRGNSSVKTTDSGFLKLERRWSR